MQKLVKLCIIVIVALCSNRMSTYGALEFQPLRPPYTGYPAMAEMGGIGFLGNVAGWNYPEPERFIDIGNVGMNNRLSIEPVEGENEEEVDDDDDDTHAGMGIQQGPVDHHHHHYERHYQRRKYGEHRPTY